MQMLPNRVPTLRWRLEAKERKFSRKYKFGFPLAFQPPPGPIPEGYLESRLGCVRFKLQVTNGFCLFLMIIFLVLLFCFVFYMLLIISKLIKQEIDSMYFTGHLMFSFPFLTVEYTVVAHQVAKMINYSNSTLKQRDEFNL